MGKMLNGNGGLPLFTSCPAVKIFHFFLFCVIYTYFFCAVPCPSRVFQVPTRIGANKKKITNSPLDSIYKNSLSFSSLLFFILFFSFVLVVFFFVIFGGQPQSEIINF